MEPQKTQEISSKPILEKENQEPTSPETAKPVESASFQTKEKPKTAEREVLSELEETERKSGVTPSSSSTSQTTVSGLQQVGQNLDPDDRLGQDEIQVLLKRKATDAALWLAKWWERQLKRLEHRKN
ncbi:hypothetical protein COS81_01340 [candidate division WWE3 bacterium CG06_land_8_20_14_3_00_42_16]|uniref:Uncharacterized protein n=4 Tax=Katanobacteria TaxID=422282 RepID=A0A2M7AP28_UNCKA|nr:MAG: hypothetical protein AUJ38_00685 [bacterium CG1_02_42_9]PIU69125.1 MAG: hypothetical protein COS81_01340 [candidate division WWE3 bacterium CG06_land_8_20_14_3_00_42_16]PIZ43758.1 MAG: hypothetical protein COY34_00385 [candidate division WWE3 bacterium CG_4_10_14_0_2_um_filter_42_8]PJA37578.1 MAG: hypothetical protein CO181_02920 [candidate division WWE3 bacterium CG_4_9_14_3_um_filter_43_9]PJC69064.1 MAG: hypothetical protein CO015_01640 [candidate division WWE3 bacterium CG_4_8_14_3_u